jgi:methionine-rich copper-binding protein CopC
MLGAGGMTMLRLFANVFRTVLVVALVLLAIALAPTVGKAFAHSHARNSEVVLNQPVVDQSCAPFEAWFLDPACDQVHVKKVVHTKHRLARN